MYQTLSRKYRPKNLQELIGQDVLVRTISNAIKFNRIPETIMLNGSYGIGKTTTARIIAKALNCKNINLDQEFIEVCNECQDCIEISKSIHPDVLEIDAASNTGVDNIRSLIENSSYFPSKAKYKVFIIDEVHMLSNSAFNALLKTLEEPPAHLKFIFATTESHKIPATIISRCQRFNLQKIPSEKLSEHLSQIATKENIKISREALQKIAKLANGSARDGLSMLDQISNYSKEEISFDDANKFFSMPNPEDIEEIFKHLQNEDMLEANKILKKLYYSGIPGQYILNEIANFTHEKIQNSDEKFIYNRIWNIVLETNKNISTMENPEIVLNVALFKIMISFRLPKISQLLENISEKNNYKIFDDNNEKKPINEERELKSKKQGEESEESMISKYFPDAIKKY